MADISNLLPTSSKTVEAIYNEYKKNGDSKKARGYLGASIIGATCERYLWYVFRCCCTPKFSGRMYRLFETGEKEEKRFVQDLRNIGCTVHEKDQSTGEQFSVDAVGGHFSGHLDGCALGIPEAPKTWHVCEFKTHNTKSYAKLVKEGVKKSKPQHYAQMMVYMGLTGMTRALYLAVNKDTDELYSERIHYNKDEAAALIARAERIITSYSPPERIASRPDYFECKFCDAHDICWNDGVGSWPALPILAVSCRQCCHATPTMDGNACWKCEKHNHNLSEEDQYKACDDHLVLPGLVNFAEPEYINHCGSGAIKFTTVNGGEFIHGNGHGVFSTKELTQLSLNMLVNPDTLKAKEVMGSYVPEITNDREDIE